MLYENTSCNRSTSIVHNDYWRLFFNPTRQLASLFILNLCLTAVCLFLLQFYSLLIFISLWLHLVFSRICNIRMSSFAVRLCDFCANWKNQNYWNLYYQQYGHVWSIAIHMFVEMQFWLFILYIGMFWKIHKWVDFWHYYGEIQDQ